MKQPRSKYSTAMVGLLAGLFAGLAASFVMNLTMRAAAVASFRSEPLEAQSARNKRLSRRVRRFQELGDPNQEILDRTSLYLTQRRIPQKLLSPAATSVHYIFGTVLGGVYGVAAEVVPAMTSGSGLVFALLWWACVNEALLPAIGLLDAPKNIPPQAHAAMLISHLVYGVSLEKARKTARRSVRGMLRE